MYDQEQLDVIEDAILFVDHMNAEEQDIVVASWEVIWEEFLDPCYPTYRSQYN